MREGDRTRALALHQRSLAEFAEHGDVYATLDGLIAIAVHAAALGRAEMAARLLGTVEAARAAGGRRLTWASVTEEGAIGVVRAALGATAFDAARKAGGALPLAEVVALALAVEAGPAEEPARAPAGGDPLGLSPREREVLRLLAEGKSNREIGEELSISPRTAGTHVASILAKLGVGSRAAAAAVALTRGLA